MARRIVTAREQHEMLSPWQRTAMPSLDDPELTKPTRLYRGVAVFGMSPENRQKISQLADYDDWDGDQSTLGKHLGISPIILQHLHEHQGGLGRYWTTNPARALDFAGRSMENGPRGMDAFPAIMHMDWDGSGLDMSNKGMASMAHNFQEDDERVLTKGHRVKVHGLQVRGGAGSASWGETINPDPDDYDFGHLHRPGFGHPGVI